MTDSDYSLEDLNGAEIVPDMGGSHTWLVRFGENEYDQVAKSPKNRLIIEKGVLDRDSFTYGGVTVDVDFEDDEYYLVRDGDEIRVPPEKYEHVLWSLYDEDGDRLNKIFDEVYTETVREGLMDMLMPSFRDSPDDIRKVEDGWLVDGEILVEWDAENYPVDVDTTHVVRGGDAVKADTEKSARDIDFVIPDEHFVVLPNDIATELTETEMKFLTTVGLILDTGYDYDDDLSTAIQASTVSGFTDPKSGLFHGHGTQKHDLSDIGVTDEAIEKLWSNSNDHSGVWELSVRRDEFENAPIDVFEDAENDDDYKWEMIENTREKAPIPSSFHRELRDRFE